MTEKEKPLPELPKTPFGRQKRFDGPEDESLLAERIAEAAARGKLDEFLQHEIPDSEYARKLVNMMMGMTGIMPSEPLSSPVEPPRDVLEAVQSGNVQGLMELLAREHQKRTGVSEDFYSEKKEETAELSAHEREVLDRLRRIASDNNVSIDWLILRALKLYIEEYQKTGRL